MPEVPIGEAQERLKALVEAALRGETVRIVLDAHQQVELVPRSAGSSAPRQLGRLRGKIVIHDDFDEPLTEFEPYM